MRDRPLRGLLVDYGGVLTTSLGDTMTGWCDAEGVDPTSFVAVMRDLLGPHGAAEAATNPIHALERGEMAVPDFENALARRLTSISGEPVRAEGLLTRMFSGFRAADGMIGVVRRARAAGIRTGLLSNSWGLDYPRDGWHELFDAVVISGEIGMRKPEPRIYLHAADALGLSPQECVFVDDLVPNVRGAVAVGMVAVHHVDVDRTTEELEAVFEISLRG